MAVNWNWEHKKGFYLIKENFGEMEKVFKVNIYCGNCLGVEIYDFKDEDDNKKYQFVGWWNDEKHLNNLLGLSKEYKGDNSYANVIEIHLFTKYKDWEKIARRFAKAKIKVVLEYEEEQQQ